MKGDGPKTDVVVTGHDRSGRKILPQRTNGIEGDDFLDTPVFQSPDVCPVVDRVGRTWNPETMTIEHYLVTKGANDHFPVFRPDRLLLPFGEKIRPDDAGSTYERDLHEFQLLRIPATAGKTWARHFARKGKVEAVIAYTFQIVLIAIGVVMWASSLIHGRVHEWLDAPVRLPAWRIPGADFLFLPLGILAAWFLEPLILTRVLGFDLTAPMETGTLLIHGYAFQLSGLAVCLLFRLHPAGRPTSGDAYAIVAAGRGFLGALYILPVLTLTKVVWEFFLNTFGLPTDLQDVVTTFQDVAASGGTLAWIIMLVVVAPISEEFVFRGGLFRFLLSRMSLRWATLISSVLFGLLHQNLFSFLPLTLLGVGLSLVYAKTGRLITPIILHMMFNLISVIFILLLSGT